MTWNHFGSKSLQRKSVKKVLGDLPLLDRGLNVAIDFLMLVHREVQVGIGWYFYIPDTHSTYSSQIQISLDVIAHLFLRQMITKPRRDCAG